MKQTEKTKRIKRVFPNHAEVIHRWANQTQDEARCKNVFFNGKSIFSYGSHYELGRLIEFNGKTVAVINDTGYSNTTSKHIHAAWHAVEHMPRVKTQGDFDKGCIRRGLVREQDRLIDNLFNHFNRVSFRSWETSGGTRGEYADLGGYAKQVKAFNAKVIEFGYSALALDLNETYIQCFNEKQAHGIARARIKDAERDAKRAVQEVERQVKAKEDVLAWRAGETKYSVQALSPQILRINENEVETPRGATVTIEQAMAFLSAIESGKIKVGTKVGEYTFNGMTTLNSADHTRERAVKVDCHTIAVSELRAVIGTAPKLSIVGEV